MTFPDLTNKLKKHIAVIQKAVVGVSIFEALLVILIGIISNKLYDSRNNVSSNSLIVLVIVCLLYLFLLGIKTAYATTFPGSITNELVAERELSILKADGTRQRTVDEFLVKIIENLNGQTCDLGNRGDNNHLCDGGIKNGIYTLVQPVIDNMYFILGAINTPIYVGVYISEYSSLEPPHHDEGIILIKDEIHKQHQIPKDLMAHSQVSGESLEIQGVIRKSFNNMEFVKHDYSSTIGKFTIVASPIPLACDNSTTGVLFIISNRIENLHRDTEVNLSIFNRIIANWLYRYNECVSNRIDAEDNPNHIEVQTPAEVPEEVQFFINGQSNQVLQV